MERRRNNATVGFLSDRQRRLGGRRGFRAARRARPALRQRRQRDERRLSDGEGFRLTPRRFGRRRRKRRPVRRPSTYQPRQRPPKPRAVRRLLPAIPR